MDLEARLVRVLKDILSYNCDCPITFKDTARELIEEHEKRIQAHQSRKLELMAMLKELESQ